VGREAVAQLLQRGARVLAIVRSRDSVSESILGNENFEAIEASILDVRREELAGYLEGCDAAVCCLGHTLSIRGIFGKPRRLVSDAVAATCIAMLSTEGDRSRPIRFVLLSSDGVDHPGSTDPPRGRAERVLLSMVKILLPPHADNVAAAKSLAESANSSGNRLEWVGVRPVSFSRDPSTGKDYAVLANPGDAILGNDHVGIESIAKLIADLLTKEKMWDEWRGKMPVVLNPEAVLK
jgi:nucleoside-diphosphate-sugar epimerase